MSKPTPIPAEKLAAYERLVETNSDVDRKGASMPYTSCKGHMFSFLDANGGMSLRLPPEALEEFLTKYKTTLSEQHGRVMKEYAVVPDNLLKKTNELKKYFDLSFSYVASLKPKPTKRKAGKKASTKKTLAKKSSARKQSRKKGK